MIRAEAGTQLPVSVRDGFDYIADPRNWLEYWPRAVSVDPDTRRQRPGDRARVLLRLAGRRVVLDMTLVRIDLYRLVEYTSEQAGLPAARHRRHFEERDGELEYRIVVEYEPRSGWRDLVDRSVVRRATERAMRETIANLHERFARGRPEEDSFTPPPSTAARTRRRNARVLSRGRAPRGCVQRGDYTRRKRRTRAKLGLIIMRGSSNENAAVEVSFTLMRPWPSALPFP